VYRNVAAMVDPPRVAKRDLSPWSADEARRFLFATRWTPLYAAYVLALGLGLRRGEVLGLYWSDVDPEDRTLRVRRQLQRVGRDLRIAPEPKSHRRVVPLPSICVVAWRWHRLVSAPAPRAPGSGWCSRPEQERRSSLGTSVGVSAPLPVTLASGWCGCMMPGMGARRCWRPPAPAARGDGDPGAQPDSGHDERLRARDARGPAGSAQAH
jgi:hypothetical protein